MEFSFILRIEKFTIARNLHLEERAAESLALLNIARYSDYLEMSHLLGDLERSTFGLQGATDPEGLARLCVCRPFLTFDLVFSDHIKGSFCKDFFGYF